MLRVGAIPVSRIRCPVVPVLRFSPTGKADGSYDSLDTGHAFGFSVDVVSGYFAWTPTPGSGLWDVAASVFTSGTYNWTAYGTNTIANDANSLKITYVDTSTGAFDYLRDASDLSADLTLGAWYILTADAKVNAGSSVLMQLSDGVNVADSAAITSTVFAGQAFNFRARHATDAYLRVSSMGAGEIAWLDNLGLKQLTLSTTAPLVDSYAPAHTITAEIHALPTGRHGGVVVMASSDMESNVKAYLSGTVLTVTKRISGTVTQLRRLPVTFVADAELKVSVTPYTGGAIVAVAYNGVLIAVETVTDAELLGNTRCGPWATDSSVTFGDLAIETAVPVSRRALDGAAAVSPSPAVGDELLTNGNMETGSPPSSWTAITAAVLTAQADERTGGAGAQCLQVANGPATGYRYAYQNPTISAGQWVRLSAWQKRGTAVATAVDVRNSGAALATINNTSTSWTSGSKTVRFSGTGPEVRCWVDDTAFNVTARFDDVSLVPYTLSTILAGGGDCSAQSGQFSGEPTVPANHHGGIAHVNDDSSDGWVAYHDRTNCVLARVGVGAAAISAAATYVADAKIEVLRRGDTFSLFYNGTKVGSDATISGLATLTKLRVFGTDAAVSVENLRVEALA